MIIEYDGSKFIGWQIQKKGRSIQGEIQKNLKKIFKREITLIGSGRTDSGVHAIAQSSNFLTDKLLDCKKLQARLNHFLKEKKISIISIKNKDVKFHSRYSAVERKYRYLIVNRKSPLALDTLRAWHIKNKLNIDIMKRGAKILVGKHDFSTFRSSSCGAKSPVRTMKKVEIIKKQNGKIYIHFVSKSFLQQQVRSMVGCIKYLGEGKWSLKKFTKVFKSKKRKMCAPPAPACGLYLLGVKY